MHYSTLYPLMYSITLATALADKSSFLQVVLLTFSHIYYS